MSGKAHIAMRPMSLSEMDSNPKMKTTVNRVFALGSMVEARPEEWP